MTLSDYLWEKRMSQREFAKLSGIHVNMISRLVKGRRKPSLETMMRIARATEDKVSSLYDYETGVKQDV